MDTEFSHVVKMAGSECVSCGTSTHSESVSVGSASDSEHEYESTTVPPSIRIYPYLIRICARKYRIRKKLSNIWIRNLVTLSKWPAVNVSHVVLVLTLSLLSVGSASDSEHEYGSTVL